MAGVAKEGVIPIEASLLALAILFVVARLFLRLVRQGQALTLSDILLVISALDAIALFTTDALAYKLGGMDEYDPDAPEPSIADQISLMKVSFAGNYFYDTGIYLPKLALLAFYFKLIPPTMPWLRKGLYAVTGITVTFTVTTCFLDTFWCGSDPSVNWSLGDDACSTFDSKEVFRIDWAMNIISDTMICTLPFPLLHRLQLSKRQIGGLIATFSLGIITMGASIGRFATVESIKAWTNVYVLSMAELAVAIMVVSMPALKSLLHRRGLASTKYGTGQSSSGLAYGKHSVTTSRFRQLSSGRDHQSTSKARVTTEDDSGSEVELNHLGRSDVIYKTARISVVSHPAHAEEGHGRTTPPLPPLPPPL